MRQRTAAPLPSHPLTPIRDTPMPRLPARCDTETISKSAYRGRADDKRRARVRVLEAACQTLSDHLDASPAVEAPRVYLASEAHRNR